MDFRRKIRKTHDAIAAMDGNGKIYLFINHKPGDVVYLKKHKIWQSQLDETELYFWKEIGTKENWDKIYDKPCILKPGQCLFVNIDL